jgi:hypothetical protein
MFRVVFVKQVFDSPKDGSRFAVLQREGQLPFPPSRGQEFFWLGSFGPEEAVSVTWNFEGDYFSCRVKNEVVDEAGFDDLDFDEAIEQAQINGWILVNNSNEA